MTPTPKFEYDQNIPTANDDLATSQAQFLSNFQQLFLAFAQNHVDFSAGATAGNHTVVELLSSPAGFETSAGEISLFAKPVAQQVDQLFLRYQGNFKDVQYTNYQLYALNQVAGKSQFFTVLPGKILIYYGSVVIPSYPYKLQLEPRLGKNIISVNLCYSGTPASPPSVNPITASSGLIKQLQINSPFGNVSTPNRLLFYFIMVNI